MEKTKKIALNTILIIAYMVLTYVFIFVGQVAGSWIAYPLTSSKDSGIKFAGMYAMFIGIWILIFAYCFIVKKNRKFFALLGKGGRGNKPGIIFGFGLVLGLGLNLLVAFVAMLNGDIHLTFNKFDPLMILLFIVAVAIQSGAEELSTRWFLYNKVKDLVPEHPLLPIIINALFFSAMHGTNSGVTPLSLFNIVIVAVLYSLVIYYFESFWACVVAHTSWNFCQSIILGLPNSGNVSAYSIWKLDAANARDSFTYNTGFGIEGTVMACVLLTIACVVVVLIGRKKGFNSLRKS